MWANVDATHALCSVDSREGSCLGSWTLTDLMFDSPLACVIVVVRLAPLAREVFELVEALNEGFHFRELQLVSAGNPVVST